MLRECVLGCEDGGAPSRKNLIGNQNAEKLELLLANHSPETKMDLFAPTHLLVLLVIVLLIFGPSKLGDVGGALGKAIKDFKHAMNEPEEAKPAAAKAEEIKPDKAS